MLLFRMVLIVFTETAYVTVSIATQAGREVRFAKVQEDIYYCHDIVRIEFPIITPDSTLQFSATPEIHRVNRAHILCAVRPYLLKSHVQ